MDMVNVQYLKQIINGLKKWREQRHLTREMQREGFIKNFKEELTEYQEAKTEPEKIDALCDMVVFLVNVWDINIEDIIYMETKLSRLTNSYVKRPLEFKEPKQLLNSAKDAKHQIIYLMAEMHSLGYDPYVSMDETIKEISSRTGKYVEEEKKWIKDTSPEAQAKWYKADYKSARLGIDRDELSSTDNFIPRR